MDVLLILLLVLVNGALAMSELAVVSAQKIRLQPMAERGDRGAIAALRLAESPTRFLSTVQIGITLIGILAGAVGQKSLTTELSAALEGLPLVGPYRDPVALALVVLSITVVSLILGELVPKRLAMVAPEKIAAHVGLPMLLLSRAARPASAVLGATTDLILRLLGVRHGAKEPVTSDEINLLLEAGAKSGEFTPEEQRLVERVLHLGDQRVGEVMTHRTEMIWLDAGLPLDRLKRAALGSRQEHFALCAGRVDRVLGVVSLRDLLGDGRDTAPAAFDLRTRARPPIFVPESAPALRVLERCRAAHAELAFVVDEYGAVLGQVGVQSLLDRLIDRVFQPKAAPATQGPVSPARAPSERR